MGRSLRPWWLALGVSLLLHGSLFSGLWWALPQWEAPAEILPFEARLLAAPHVVEAPPQSSRTPPGGAVTPPAHPVRDAPPPHAHPPAPPVEPADTPAVSEAPEEAALTEREAPVEPVPGAQSEVVAVAETAAQAEAAPPPLNPLPPRLDLRYKVHFGVVSGEQTLLWVNEGAQRYTLISVAEATGVAGLFYRGRFVQTSRGRITSRGLQPETFWDQRGDKRSSAQFDTAQGLLTLTPAKGAPRHFPYQGDIQDVLSLFFQLALTAPPPEGRLTYRVFNGKKLRDYVYEVRGEAALETALGTLRTLHLARVADGDGRFEIWLSIDRHYLPVRVLSSDDKGNEVELKLQSIAP